MNKISLYLGKRHITHLAPAMLLIAFLWTLSACGPTVNQPSQQQKVTIDKTFQNQKTPAPQPAIYRCGAWASNNAPGAYSIIIIYAKLTKNVAGVSGASASGVVHFDSGDAMLDQQPMSDSGGYVSFSLPLMGRQSRGIPATVDVNFIVDGQTVQCSPAFFTPQ